MTTADLAVIGNGMFGALLDGKGCFVWCCIDTFDGEPVFNSLLNNGSDKTGFYDIVLEDCERAEQRYLHSSAVLVTTLHSSKGDSLEIRDFAPRFVHFDRIFRPFQLFRTIKRLKGDPRIRIRIRPTFQYNATDGYQTRGSAHVRFCGPVHTWRVTTNTSVRHILEEIPFLVPAEPVHIVFGSDESFTNSLRNVAMDFEEKTVSYWINWCNSLCLPVEYQEVLIRAAMTLCMLQSDDCGGFLASLSMGLPLGPYCGSTCDTRVCRLLDECLALPVLREMGLFEVCKRFLSFAKEVCFMEDPPQHTYTPWRSSKSKPREWAPYLAGYRGLGEVHHGGPLLEVPEDEIWECTDSAGDPLVSAGDCPGFDDRTVVYSLLIVALAHAFFDIRLREELCSPKLFEKLERYALHACDNFQMALQSYKSALQSSSGQPNGNGHGGGSHGHQSSCSSTSAAGRQRCRPPAGASFFDDDLAFFSGQDSRRQSSPTLPVRKNGTTLPAVHTLTSVLCWAAADRMHRLSSQAQAEGDGPHKATYWQKRAQAMREAINQHAWCSKTGAFRTYWGGDESGPSLLRMAELGFISAEDSRFRDTVRCFEKEALAHAVCHGTDEHGHGPGSMQANSPAYITASGHASTLGGGGGGGGSCTSSGPDSSACFMTNTLLWYCEALRSIRATTECRRLLDSLIKSSKHRGLLPEAIDLKTSEFWGNAPSVNALLSLLRVSSRLSRTWREV
eukprot:TRINITY_DN124015_c0_g1_i1.p1 TRINITY_DN124015_c0_g1~~TRINITY_DN124015_c0_g1_i1.p1  ORF type:complete len:730 (-),score=139.68 TRINITY_DN124015_c0_g1_i1:109-2298(-)